MGNPISASCMTTVSSMAGAGGADTPPPAAGGAVSSSGSSSSPYKAKPEYIGKVELGMCGGGAADLALKIVLIHVVRVRFCKLHLIS